VAWALLSASSPVVAGVREEDIRLEKRRGGKVRLIMQGECIAELGKEDFEWLVREAKRKGFVRPSLVKMRLPELHSSRTLKVALWLSQHLKVPLTG